MKILAFDLSLVATGHAMVEYDGNRKVQNELITVIAPGKGLQQMVRLHAIKKNVIDRCSEGDMILFEDFSYGSNDPSAQERVGLAYLIRYEFWIRGMPIILVAPSTLKKFVTGKGNSPKELMIREVFRRFNAEVKDNNEADAVGLLYLGLALKGLYQVPTAPQADAVETVRKSHNLRKSGEELV